MQQILKQEMQNQVIVELVDNRPKLSQEELKLLWEGIESAQNMRDLCYHCGKPCGKTITSEYSCELMQKLKDLSNVNNDVNY